MILNSPDAFPHRKTQWNTNAGTIRKFNQIAVNITKYNQIEVVIFLFFVISTRQASFQPLSSSAFAADSSWRPRSLATNLCRNTDLRPRRRVTPIHSNTHQNHGGRPPNPNLMQTHPEPNPCPPKPYRRRRKAQSRFRAGEARFPFSAPIWPLHSKHVEESSGNPGGAGHRFCARPLGGMALVSRFGRARRPFQQRDACPEDPDAVPIGHRKVHLGKGGGV